MAGFKNGTIILNKGNYASPDTNEIVIRADNDGNVFANSKYVILSDTPTISGGSGDITRSEVSNISGNLQSQINTKIDSSALTPYTLRTETADVSGYLQNQINGISPVDTTIVHGGTGIQVVESPNDTFIISVSGNYATVSQVSSLTGSLQSEINSKIDSSSLTPYTLKTETANISGYLNTKIDSINLVQGSNITIIESPANTWTISAAISGGGTDHNTLANLQGGATNQYYHLTASQATDYIGKTEVSSISGYLQNEIDNSSTNPAGENGYIQYNSAGSLGASVKLQWNTADSTLLVDGSTKLSSRIYTGPSTATTPTSGYYGILGAWGSPVKVGFVDAYDYDANDYIDLDFDVHRIKYFIGPTSSNTLVGVLDVTGQTYQPVWNHESVEYTALQINPTDNGSNANSKIMDLSINDTSKFSVRKDGLVQSPIGITLQQQASNPDNNNTIYISSLNGHLYRGSVDVEAGGTSCAPGASSFITLTDAPSSYSGQNGKFVRVNLSETGVEFASPTVENSYTYANVSSTPYNIPSSVHAVYCDASLISYPTLTVLTYSASANPGKFIYIKKTDNSVRTITISASDFIDDSNTYIITDQYQVVKISSDGTQWRVLGNG